MLQCILQECTRLNLVFQPKTVILDFEQATHIAFQRCIPSTAILGCRFHFAQAVFRKIATLGLKPIYTDVHNPIGQWLRKFFALPLLPASDIGDAYAFDIDATRPDDDTDAIDKFADYIVSTYIDDDALFPPYVWAAAPDADMHHLPRTTNA